MTNDRELWKKISADEDQFKRAVGGACEELVKVLEDARIKADTVADALTVRELCKRTGLGNTSVLEWLHQLVDDGEVEVIRIKIKRIDGVRTAVPAYRLIQDNSHRQNDAIGDL